MNSRRYRSYRRAQDWIDRMAEGGVPPEPVALLHEIAEDLLLTRDGEADDADIHADHAAVTLLELISDGRVPRVIACEVWDALQGAGPDSLRPTGEDATLLVPSGQRI